MRTLLILIFVVFSLGAMAAFEGAGQTADKSASRSVYSQPGTLTGAVSFVRKTKSHRSIHPSSSSWMESSASDSNPPRLQVGDVLPEGTQLHPIPRHESYRYAIVQGRRAIVDAGSRQIVYVLQ